MASAWSRQNISQRAVRSVKASIRCDDLNGCYARGVRLQPNYWLKKIKYYKTLHVLPVVLWLVFLSATCIGNLRWLWCMCLVRDKIFPPHPHNVAPCDIVNKEGITGMALFKTLRRFNHSCRINTRIKLIYFTQNEIKPGKFEARMISRVACGEELTINYCKDGVTTDTLRRCHDLMERYGFHCGCSSAPFQDIDCVSCIRSTLIFLLLGIKKYYILIRIVYLLFQFCNILK